MSDNTAGSQTSIPLMPRTSSEADRSYVEILRKDHARINKLIKFYNKTDKLESSIYGMIEDIAIRDFTPEDPPYDSDEVKLMIGTTFALQAKFSTLDVSPEGTIPIPYAALSPEHLSDQPDPDEHGSLKFA